MVRLRQMKEGKLADLVVISSRPGALLQISQAHFTKPEMCPTMHTDCTSSPASWRQLKTAWRAEAADPNNQGLCTVEVCLLRRLGTWIWIRKNSSWQGTAEYPYRD